MEKKKIFRELLLRLDKQISKDNSDHKRLVAMAKAYDLLPSDLASNKFMDICDVMEKKGYLSPENLCFLTSVFPEDENNSAFKDICCTRDTIAELIATAEPVQQLNKDNNGSTEQDETSSTRKATVDSNIKEEAKGEPDGHDDKEQIATTSTRVDSKIKEGTKEKPGTVKAEITSTENGNEIVKITLITIMQHYNEDMCKIHNSSETVERRIKLINELTDTKDRSLTFVNKMMDTLKKNGIGLGEMSSGSLYLEFTISSKKALNKLWNMFLSGDLSRILQEGLVTPYILKQCNIKSFQLNVVISEKEYEECLNHLDKQEDRIEHDDTGSTREPTYDSKLTVEPKHTQEQSASESSREATDHSEIKKEAKGKKGIEKRRTTGKAAEKRKNTAGIDNTKDETPQVLKKSKSTAECANPAENNQESGLVLDNLQKDDNPQKTTEGARDEIHVQSPQPEMQAKETDGVTSKHRPITNEPSKFDLSDTDVQLITKTIRDNDISNLEDLVLKIYGTDVNKKSLCNILFIAAGIGSLECCQFLLDMEFTANAFSAHASILKALPNISCKQACISPLEISIQNNKPEHVRLLVKYSNIKVIEKCQVMPKELEDVLMAELRERLTKKFSPEAHVVAGYEDDSPVLIVYSDTENHEIETFGGKKVKLINLKGEYALGKAYHSETSPQMSTNDMTIARQIIKERSEELWETHSNLNIISMSATKYVQGEEKVSACITLYCTSKGIIPLGESSFPTTLCTRDGALQLPVDVREGYFDFCPSYVTSAASTFHEKLKMGCSVGNLQHPTFESGTIGPFVDVDGQTGFLTCAHVLLDINNGRLNYIDETLSRISVVQPSVGSLMMTDKESDAFRSALHTPCGYVKRAVFNPHQETSIDAALVMITNPNRLPEAGQFAVNSEYNYRDAGFAELPIFNTGKQTDQKDVRTIHQVIKCGKTTHLTRGLPIANGVEVRPLSVNLGLPSMTRTFIMKNQILIAGISGHRTFYQYGDSGAAVFIVTEEGALECIGMGIGVTSDQMAVVTPIKSILEALGPNIKLKEF